MSAALGFAPHSGWAAVVAVGAAGEEPRVLARERIEIAEARDHGSRQPYHAVEGLPVEEAARRLAVYEAAASRMASEAVQRLVDHLAGGGHHAVGAGILESAGRKGRSLAETLTSHALIHTADGDHFRSAIAAAAARSGLPPHRVRARDLEREAAAVIGRAPEALRRAVQELGRGLGPPWGADQKAAALLAWLVLRRST